MVAVAAERRVVTVFTALILMAALLPLGAPAANAAVASGHTLEVWPDIEMVLSTGWNEDDLIHLEVWRNGVVYAEANQLADPTGLIEINHAGAPGGAGTGDCWGPNPLDTAAIEATPNIRPGDTVTAQRIVDGLPVGIADSTVVRDIKLYSATQDTPDGDVTFTGHVRPTVAAPIGAGEILEVRALADGVFNDDLVATDFTDGDLDPTTFTHVSTGIAGVLGETQFEWAGAAVDEELTELTVRVPGGTVEGAEVSDEPVANCPPVADPPPDPDEDGVAGTADNCPLIANPLQENADLDSAGDACDAFPLDATETTDGDGDGTGDNGDNCPLIDNDQENTDGDAQGNACDADDDNDGVPDATDAFPLDAAESVNTDGDLLGNNADTDDDNDGVLDADDAFPLDAAESADADGDGIGDNADANDSDGPTGDSDGDGVLNSADACDTQSGPISNNGCPVIVSGGSTGGGGSVTVPRDITRPFVVTHSASRLFSPNADGRLETMDFDATMSEATEWTFKIMDGETQLHSASGLGNTIDLTWDGMSNGLAVEDGTYSWLLEGKDAAGNALESIGGNVTLDTTATLINLIRFRNSPFDMTAADVMRIRIGVDDAADLMVKIKRNGRVIKTFADRHADGASILRYGWRGRGDDGLFVSGGRYRLVVKTSDEAQNASVSRATFRVIN